MAFLVVLGGCRRESAASSASTSGALSSASSAAAAVTVDRRESRGIWLWKTKALLDEEGAAARIATTCKSGGITEIYFSVGQDRFDHPRLPAFLKTLHDAGLRIEALMGEATWYQPAARKEMLAAIDAVAAFNAAHSAVGFSAIHLDVEPHQIASNKGLTRAYIPPFIDAMREARARAETHGMGFGADVPRKMLMGSLDERTALVSACPRLFLMLYELRHREGEEAAGEMARTSGELVRNAYEAKGVGQIVIGVSVEDYNDRLTTILSTLESANHLDPHYGGWAIHDYAHYADLRTRPEQSTAPGDAR